MFPWHPFARAAHPGHRMERGDLRYVLLDLLAERPSYGYELIRSLEERFHGFYAPSPGTVYPTLQWLQDLGYVTSSEQDGRKIYTITDEGRRFLAARAPQVDEIWERMRGWWSPFEKKEFREELRAFMQEVQVIGRALRRDARWASPDKLRRVREVVARAAREIEAILREPEPRSAEGGAQSTGQSPPPGPAGTAGPGDTPVNV